jgi:WD40 repeat protein
LPLRARTGPLAFTPDGQSLACVSADRAGRGIFLWDLADRRERLVLGTHNDRPLCLAVAPDGRTIAAGYRDGKVIFWSPLTGRSDLALSAHKRDVQSLAFSPNGRVLATGGGDGTIRLWSMPRAQPVRTITGPFKEVRSLTFSRDGQLLASGHGGTAIVWHAASGERRETLRAHKFAVSALVFLRDDKALATAGWDRFIKLWPVPPKGKPPGPGPNAN